MKKIETEKGKIGRIGEDTASKFLVKTGFSILERNYRKKWGEIDIVAQKADIIHFVEVKTVSRENLKEFSPTSLEGAQEKGDGYRPEDNVHPWKMKRLSRTIQSYLAERGVREEKGWQFDVVTVYLDLVRKEAKVFILEDVIL